MIFYLSIQTLLSSESKRNITLEVSTKFPNNDIETFHSSADESIYGNLFKFPSWPNYYSRHTFFSIIIT